MPANLKNPILILILLSFSSLLSINTWAASPTFDDSIAAALLAKINGYRVSQGLTALKSNSKLAGIAKSRINAMYSSNTLISGSDPSHNIPGFGSFSTHSRALGLNPVPQAQGENFTASTRGIDALYSNWLGSSSHTVNILDDRYVYSGMAVSSNLESVGDPSIPANITPGGLVAIQVFTSADAIDGKAATPAPTTPTPSNNNPAPTNNTPTTRPTQTPSPKPATPRPADQPKPAAPAKPKIDKTQKVSLKMKFDEVAVVFTRIFG